MSLRARLTNVCNALWYDDSRGSLALLPLAWIFAAAVTLRQAAYRIGVRRVHRFSVPVIVVGNLTVGGSGKTPLVIWLARYLRNAGYRPAVVSRGYGGSNRGGL